MNIYRKGVSTVVAFVAMSLGAILRADDNTSNSGGKNDGGSGSFDPPEKSGDGSTQHDNSQSDGGDGSKKSDSPKDDDSHDRAETDAGHKDTDHSTTAHGDVEQDQSTYKTRGQDPDK